MLNLPTELGLRVLDQLPFADRQRVRATCRTWRDVVDAHLEHDAARTVAQVWAGNAPNPARAAMLQAPSPRHNRFRGESQSTRGRVVRHNMYDWWFTDTVGAALSMRQTPTHSTQPHGVAWNASGTRLITFSGVDVTLYDCTAAAARRIGHQRIERLAGASWWGDDVAVVTCHAALRWHVETDMLTEVNGVRTPLACVEHEVFRDSGLGLVVQQKAAAMLVYQDTGDGLRRLGAMRHDSRLWLAAACMFEGDGHVLAVTLQNGDVHRIFA